MSPDEWPARLKGEGDRAYGYRVGFADIFLKWYELNHYSVEFRAGYREGKDKIDQLVDDAAQARCFG